MEKQHRLKTYSDGGRIINNMTDEPQDIEQEKEPLEEEDPERLPLWRSRTARQEAAVLLLVALIAIGGWLFFRKTATEPPTPPKAASTAGQKPVPTLSQLVICTGVDSKGIPTGVSDTYTQDRLRQTGAMAFLTFSGAVPQKTTFQIRWTNENGTYQSAVRPFERETDSIRLNLGKDLPPGRHVIEFLVDGVVQRTASMTVQPSAKKQETAAAKKRTPVEPPVLETTISVLAPEEVPAVSAPPPREEAPARKTEPEARTESPEPEPIPVVTYTAKHWHAIGSCSGEIKLTPQNIEFTSAQHTLKFGIYQVQLDGDGIQDPSGRAWHFFIQGVDVERMLGKWKNGDLFTSVSQDETAAVPSGESRKAKTRRYPAKHKHRLGSCSGELILTADVLEFSSKQHYVKSYTGSTQIEGDGILDRTGQSWRFDIQGENAGNLLRSWKDGSLFEAAQPTSK